MINFIKMGVPEKKIRYLGGGSEKKMEFFKFLTPPPLINNERSLKSHQYSQNYKIYTSIFSVYSILCINIQQCKVTLVFVNIQNITEQCIFCILCIYIYIYVERQQEKGVLKHVRETTNH